jgi:hypothetical protein
VFLVTSGVVGKRAVAFVPGYNAGKDLFVQFAIDGLKGWPDTLPKRR